MARLAFGALGAALLPGTVKQSYGSVSELEISEPVEIDPVPIDPTVVRAVREAIERHFSATVYPQNRCPTAVESAMFFSAPSTVNLCALRASARIHCALTPPILRPLSYRITPAPQNVAMCRMFAKLSPAKIGRAHV